jgi:multisubunit Na+/H+ antiporter MnhB subunit
MGDAVVEETDKTRKRMKWYQRIGLRVAIAVAVGLLVTALATAVAWREVGNMDQVQAEQQGLAHPSVPDFVRIGLMCGVLAFVLTLATFDPLTIRRREIPLVATAIGLTIVGAFVLACFMSLVQIANYH